MAPWWLIGVVVCLIFDHLFGRSMAPLVMYLAPSFTSLWQPQMWIPYLSHYISPSSSYPSIQTSNTISFLPGDPKRPLAVMSGHQAGCNTDHWAIIIYIYCQTLTVHPKRDLYRYIYHLSHFIIITLIMVTNQISRVNLYSYHCRLVSVVLPSSYTAG